MAALRRGNFPKIEGLKLVPHCGIESSSYSEYLLALEGSGTWPSPPLGFKVGSSRVSFGDMSPLLILLCESVYSSSDFLQEEFLESYPTLQIEGSDAPQEDACVALFYLNSHYLRPFRTSARIFHLADPKEPYPLFAKAVDGDLVRERIRVRRRPEALPAVILFNAAAVEWGDSKFLGFYRVLEYFFRRGTVLEFGRMRRDTTISDAQLLAQTRLDREAAQLQALLRAALTVSERSRVVAYVARHHLAASRSIDDVAAALYAFRNTLVEGVAKGGRRARSARASGVSNARARSAHGVGGGARRA